MDSLRKKVLPRVYLLLFYTSFLLIAYQVLFTRIFALEEWQTYTGIIITFALCGFGISGSVIAFFYKKIVQDPEKAAVVALFLSLFSFSLCLLLYGRIPFNPFEVLWSPVHLFYFFLRFFIVLLPFTCAPAVIGIQLAAGENVPRLYFATLAGSALGGLFSFGLLYLLTPMAILEILVLLFALLTLFYGIRTNPARLIRGKPILFYTTGVLFVILFLVTHFYFSKERISQYKDLYAALHLPGAKVVLKKNTPRGIMHVVEAEGLRSVYGLSLNYTGPVYEQKAVYLDGNLITAIYPADQALKTDFFSYTSSALPYHLVSRSRDRPASALLVSTGGGEGLYRGIAYGIDRIDALEENRELTALMEGAFADFSGRIYHRERVRLIAKNVRDFMEGTQKGYDIIDITHPASSTGSIYSASSTGENYLFTIEGLTALVEHLKPGGILSFTGHLMQPPRDSVKLFAALHTVLKKTISPESMVFHHILFIRSINTFTICVSRSPFDTARVRDFCRARSFDLVYLHDLEDWEVNRHFAYSRPIYHTPVSTLAAAADDSPFIADYLFDISPATDNRPYHYNFFKLTTISGLKEGHIRRIPFTRWGIIIYFMLLIPVILIAAGLTLIPLLVLPGRQKEAPVKEKLPVYCYFFLIGLGYFCIEIPFIQKFILFLSIPVFSFSIILTSLLLASGLGSFVSAGLGKKGIMVSFACIILYLILFTLFADPLLKGFMKYGTLTKAALTALLTAIPGFFMGMPFPAMLSRIGTKDITRSWAWGINGFASVLGSLGASIVCIKLGFSVVLVVGIVLYGMAGFFFGLLAASD